MEKIITSIAQKYFDVQTLEKRNLDMLDFHEVGVGSMKAALEAAYNAGKQEKFNNNSNLNFNELNEAVTSWFN